jgi:hypothetical protein
MSIIVTVIYEFFYTIFYFGILFSKRTLLSLVNKPTISIKIIFLFCLFSGFFVPYVLKLLKIKLSKLHYFTFLALVCCLYAISQWYYYSINRGEKNFHPFLQIYPTEQHVHVPKPRGLYRILCLGGSTTEGDMVTIPYPQLLESMLRAKYFNNTVEVINAGKYFYTTQHSIIQYLFYLEDLSPDLIIMFEAINDILPSFLTPPFAIPPFRKDYGNYYGALAYIRFPVSFERFLLNFFYADLRRGSLNAAQFSDLKSLSSFQRNLETIIEITRYRGIKLILSDQAHCFSVKNDSEPQFVRLDQDVLIDKAHYADEKSWYDAMELFNKAAMDTAKKYSVPFVNQANAFKGKREFFTDPVHMTTEGNRLKAQLFFDKIVELGLIKEKRQP